MAGPRIWSSTLGHRVLSAEALPWGGVMPCRTAMTPSLDKIGLSALAERHSVSFQRRIGFCISFAANEGCFRQGNQR